LSDYVKLIKKALGICIDYYLC